jgi:molybdenum cofactor biosynthesis enzyme MoaA
MTWECGAIDSGVAIFPDGKIRPCCQAAADYSKPLSSILDKDRFADIKKTDKPSACKACWSLEDDGFTSYRKFYTKGIGNTKITYLDFRHTNQCNLRCRYCGPHFSNRIAKELNIMPSLKTVDLNPYLDDLLVDTVKDIYFTGGEPFISEDHFTIISKLVETGWSKNITLRYNTNMSVTSYKGNDFFDCWKHFKSVSLRISLDAAGQELNYIRSGSSWDDVQSNIKKMIDGRSKNLEIMLAPVISNLNIWFLKDLVDFAKDNKLMITPTVLQGPDYLSVSALPANLKQRAADVLEQIKEDIDIEDYTKIKQKMEVDDEPLFRHTIQHVLLLDKLRGENLFDLLPFTETAKQTILRNYEYE